MNELNYQIVRSAKRKTLTITVERDRKVIVHVPQGIPDQAVQQVLNAKRQWILEKSRHPQKYEERRHPPGKEVVNGESAPFLGTDYRIEAKDTATGDIEFSGRFLVPPERQAMRREVLRDWYIRQAKERILARVEQRAREIGVKFTSARIVDNRYRWGSCTPGGSVNFNWRLIKAPMFVIDYVIVHELAHLIEPNHSPEFWNILRANSPATEKARLWLKQHGQLLEEEV
jgi:predicted metal-dependent hydrolase